MHLQNNFSLYIRFWHTYLTGMKHYCHSIFLTKPNPRCFNTLQSFLFKFAILLNSVLAKLVDYRSLHFIF